MPSHGTFSRLFRQLDPEQFRAASQRFMAVFSGQRRSLAPGTWHLAPGAGPGAAGVVAIDGKALRRPFDRASGTSALRMVSAWGCEQWLVLAQVATGAKGLAAIGKVRRIRETAAGTTAETACHLLSAALLPDRLNEVARSHRGVGDQLHWRLDAVMNDGQDRTRLGHGPENLAALRHTALNATQAEPGKGPLRGKLKRAGWDGAHLTQPITLPQMR